jgi:outer membrane protein assembly factor BamD
VPLREVVMRRTLRRAGTALALLILALPALAGCGHKEADKKMERLLTADELYKRGLEQLKPHRAFLFFHVVDTEEAIATFQQIVDNFPESDYALQAQLQIAQAYFNDEKYEEAESHYKEFMETHPTHGSVPQAMYQAGMCKFKAIPIKERDQTKTKEAAGYFELLINKFPDSPYAEQSRQRLQECKARLAEHAYFVAEFYMKREDYRGALNRCSTILANYPGAGWDARALYCVGVSQYHLNESDKAREALEELVEQYPADTRAGAARSYLARLKSSNTYDEYGSESEFE